MAFCLLKEQTDKFLEAIKSGKIVPEKLIEMTSEQRRNFLSEIVGKENAKEVNALLESKLLLKDQKRGLVTLAKQINRITKTKPKNILFSI